MLKWLKRIFSRPNIKTPQELADYCGNSLSKLGWFIETHLYYKPDKSAGDEWKPVERIMTEWTADCEEFAILAYTICELMGYDDTHILCVYPPRLSEGHAVCAVRKEDNLWNYFDNGTLHICPSKIKTLEDVAHYIKPSLAMWRETNSKGVTLICGD